MDPKPKSHAAEYLIGAGYVLWFCLALVTCSAFYYFVYVQPRLASVNTFATQLPPLTVTPHVLPATQQAASETIADAFDDNQHHWAYSDTMSKIEIKNGKLVVESLKKGSIAIAACNDPFCTPGDQPYFLQADFSTDVKTDQGYGILFNQLNNGEHFFLFEVNPAAKGYRFYHRTADGWSIRMGGDSDLIKSFPAVNTLGIYVNKETVEFYVNGELVDAYTESGRSFQLGKFAFSSDNAGFRLTVDNLSISR